MLGKFRAGLNVRPSSILQPCPAASIEQGSTAIARAAQRPNLQSTIESLVCPRLCQCHATSSSALPFQLVSMSSLSRATGNSPVRVARLAGFGFLCYLTGYHGIDAAESALLFRAGSR